MSQNTIMLEECIQTAYAPIDYAPKQNRNTINKKIDIYRNNFQSSKINPYLNEIADILTGNYRDSKRGRIWSWTTRLNTFSKKLENLETYLANSYNNRKISEQELVENMNQVKKMFETTVLNNKYFKNYYGGMNLEKTSKNKLDSMIEEYTLLRDNPKEFKRISSIRKGLSYFMDDNPQQWAWKQTPNSEINRTQNLLLTNYYTQEPLRQKEQQPQAQKTIKIMEYLSSSVRFAKNFFSRIRKIA